MRGHILYLESGVSIHFCYDCMVTHPFICSLLSEEIIMEKMHTSSTDENSNSIIKSHSFNCSDPHVISIYSIPVKVTRANTEQTLLTKILPKCCFRADNLPQLSVFTMTHVFNTLLHLLLSLLK